MWAPGPGPPLVLERVGVCFAAALSAAFGMGEYEVVLSPIYRSLEFRSKYIR